MPRIIPKVEQIIMDTYLRYHSRHDKKDHVWWRSEVEELLDIIIKNCKEHDVK